MQDLDPHLLRAFLSVADVGTVNGAALKLHRTQAAVSMQIRRLEQVVGEPLFERSSRGLTVTVAGAVLLPYAREILTLNAEANRRISGHRIEARVKLGVVEDFAATHLIGILKSFRQQNPGIHVDLHLAGNRHLAELHASGEVDLVICDSTAVAHEPLALWQEKLQWVGRADLLLDREQVLPVVMFSEFCAWHTKEVAVLAHSHVRWQTACEASTMVAMATAVLVGMGVGPMVLATAPSGCTVLDGRSDMPEPIDIDFGLFAHNSASGEARYLADFVARLSAARVAEPAL